MNLTEGITGLLSTEGIFYRLSEADSKDPQTIRAVAREMESLFLYQLLRLMRKTADVFRGSSLQRDVYTTLIDIHLARLLAEKGTGLGDLIERGLKGLSADVTAKERWGIYRKYK